MGGEVEINVPEAKVGRTFLDHVIVVIRNAEARVVGRFRHFVKTRLKKDKRPIKESNFVR